MYLSLSVVVAVVVAVVAIAIVAAVIVVVVAGCFGPRAFMHRLEVWRTGLMSQLESWKRTRTMGKTAPSY